MGEWFKARKTAIAEARDATPEDEQMIRRMDGGNFVVLGVNPDAKVYPHYLILRGGQGEEYPISREVFGQTYERIENDSAPRYYDRKSGELA